MDSEGRPVTTGINSVAIGKFRDDKVDYKSKLSSLAPTEPPRIDNNHTERIEETEGPIDSIRIRPVVMIEEAESMQKLVCTTLAGCHQLALAYSNVTRSIVELLIPIGLTDLYPSTPSPSGTPDKITNILFQIEAIILTRRIDVQPDPKVEKYYETLFIKRKESTLDTCVEELKNLRYRIAEEDKLLKSLIDITKSTDSNVDKIIKLRKALL